MLTYSSASNFIQRPPKLAFTPLETLEYEDDGEVESMNGVPVDDSFMLDNNNNTNYAVVHDSFSAQDNNQIMYSGIQDPHVQEAGSVCYASIQDSVDVINDGNLLNNHQKFVNLPDFPSKSCFYQYNEHDHGDSLTNSHQGNTNQPFPSPSLLRAKSPSISSTCTYASINMPEETKLYSTIPEAMGSSLNHTSAGVAPKQFGLRPQSHVLNSNINQHTDIPGQHNHGSSSTINTRYPTFQSNNNKQSVLCPPKRSFDQSPLVPAMYKARDNKHNMYPPSYDSNGNFGNSESMTCYPTTMHTPVNETSNQEPWSNSTTHQDLANNNHKTMTTPDNTFRTNVHNGGGQNGGGNLHIDFCACSDDQHSCGKQHEDDVTSVLGTIGGEGDRNAGSSSCKGCGRIIRQITWSESFSDETYEHVYSSRLLTRRRFSSPDITWSEAASDIPDSNDVGGPRSRDDTWMPDKRYDVTKSPCSIDYSDARVMYCPCGGSSDNVSANIDTESVFSNEGTKSLAPGPLSKLLRRRSTSPVSSESSSLSGPLSGPPSRYRSLDASTVQSPIEPTQFEDKVCSSAPAPADVLPSVAIQTTKQKPSEVLVEPKASGLSGLFSMFSRGKSKQNKSDKVQSASSHKFVENSHQVTSLNASSPSQIRSALQASINRNVQDNCGYSIESNMSQHQLKPVPNPLTNKLSKHDTVEDQNEVNDLRLHKHLPTSISKNATNQKNCNEDIQASGWIDGLKTNVAIDEDTQANEWINDLKAHIASVTEDPMESQTNAYEVIQFETHTHETTVPSKEEASKQGNKTDSGDTCYEYDISTSSEGEDQFLAKVKKTLNLEEEVKHIAESSLAWKKLLCKKCRKDGLLHSNDDNQSCSDISCPSVSSKFGDLKAIFGDLVVDQRAAILDCLTDFAHSPYNVKCQGHESHCRDCGGDIMTSDSESLTTVYSMMSQHMTVVSTGKNTPSNDSDEGTMADNSDESADETRKPQRKSEENITYTIKPDKNNNDSSGYDEPEVEQCATKCHRSKKREKAKDKTHKKVYSWQMSNHAKKSGHFGLAQEPKALDATKQVCTDDYEFMKLEADSSFDDVLDTKRQDGKRSGNHPLSEKTLSDIYSPLPGKAMSLLTASLYNNHTSPCSCTKHKDDLHFQEAQYTIGELSQKNKLHIISDVDKPLIVEPEQMLKYADSNNEKKTKVSKPKDQQDEQSSKELNKPAISPKPTPLPKPRTMSVKLIHTPTPDQKQLQFRRRRKLELATLDLLPETSLGGDEQEDSNITQEDNNIRNVKPQLSNRIPQVIDNLTTSDIDSANKSELTNIERISNDSKPIRRTKSSNVGKIALLFEQTSAAKQNSNLDIDNSCRGLAGANKVSVRSIKSGILKSEANSSSEQKMVADKRNEDVTKKLSRKSKQYDTSAVAESGHISQLFTLEREKSTESSAGKLRSRSRSGKEKSSKSSKQTLTKHLSHSNKSLNVPHSKGNDRSDDKRQSPTPSTSSSTSSSSKRKGVSKHRRAGGKNAYQKKRSKSRSERSKSRGKGETRTCYYFSSDLSDIDTVEVDDYDTYAKALTPEVRSTDKRSSSKRGTRRSSDSNRKSSKRESVVASSSESTCASVVTSNLQNESDTEQEVYAIPPSSSELRGMAKGEKNMPQAVGQESSKPKKNKRIDVYRSRKGHNTMLSDLIIRNYDMQVFGNV